MSDIQNKNSLGLWYWSMTYKQRLLCWIVSIALIFVYGTGLIFFVPLLYCQLGKERYSKGSVDNTQKPEQDNVSRRETKIF